MIKTKLGLGGWANNFKLIYPGGREETPKGYGDNDPIFNRIVDAGLDMPASHYFVDCFTVGAIGTGTSGTTDDMTKLESYALHSNTYPESGDSNGYPSTSGLNGFTFDLDSTQKYIELKRTFTLTNNTGSTIPVSEASVGNENSSNPDIFSRILLPSAINLEDGVSLQFTYNLRINYPLNANNPQARTIQIFDGASLIDVTGQEQTVIKWKYSEGYPSYYNGLGIFYPDSDGSRFPTNDYSDYRWGYGGLDPKMNDRNFRLGANSNTDIDNFREDVKVSGDCVYDPYVAGSRQVIRKYTLGSTFYPLSSFRSLCNGTASRFYNSTSSVIDQVSVGDSYYNIYGCGWIFVSDEPFTKQVGRKWTVTQTLSWDRA